MTVRYTVDVFCDKCGNWFHYQVVTHPRNKLARDAAKRAGWITKKSQSGFLIDVCPGCQKEETP